MDAGADVGHEEKFGHPVAVEFERQQVARDAYRPAVEFPVREVGFGDALLRDFIAHCDQAVDVYVVLPQHFHPRLVVGERVRVDFIAGLEPVVHRRHHAELVKRILVESCEDIIELGFGRNQIVPGDFAGFCRGRHGRLQQQRGEQEQDEGRRLFDHDLDSVKAHKRTVMPSISA